MAKAPIYDLITEFGDGDSTDANPFWVIAVIPLALPLSFSRSSMSSVSKHPADGANTRGDTIIITGDCTQLTIASNKDSHIKQLQASLMQSERNYLVEILPGDWVMAWIVNSEHKALAEVEGLVDRIKSGTACNNFDDGLKFVGRVESIRKNIQRTDNALSVNYSLSASAFTELDSHIFYDHALAEAAKDQVLTWMAKIGLDIRKLFVESENGNNEAALKDNVHIIIPALVEILLGAGLPNTINPFGKGELQATFGSLASQDGTDPQEAPFAYLVPKEVGDLLGKTSRSPSKAGGILAYADLLDMLFGVQHYSNTNAESQAYLKFIPDINQSAETNLQHKYTGTPLMGAFLPLMPELSNTPFWNVLEQFLNPACNEMYTALRVNDAGKVVPTLVLRQIPFTTPEFADALEQSSDPFPVTRFHNLPRWKVDPKLLKSVNIGRSNATRVNFVHVYGQNGYGKNLPITYQITQNRPIQDELDIQRSGLRAYMTTIACDFQNQAGKVPTKWMQQVADRLVGSQLSVNGTMTMIGISAPICEGDNLDFDGTLFHIESVVHNCVLETDGTGHRTFTTSVTLTNGLRSDVQPNTNEPNVSSNPDLAIYPGIDLSDNLTYDPGQTTESRTEPTKPVSPNGT